MQLQPNKIRLNQLFLKIVKSKDYFPNYYMKLDGIIKRLKISFDDIYEIDQIGGSGSKHIYETKIKLNLTHIISIIIHLKLIKTIN